jgi:cysteine dioxygenase
MNYGKSADVEDSSSTMTRPTKRPRHICSLGTGEIIHIVHYKAKDNKIDEFELVVQGLARCLYSIEASVTDVRVCHPKCGEVIFIVTFITREALLDFQRGPQAEFERSLQGLTDQSSPSSNEPSAASSSSNSGSGSGTTIADITGASAISRPSFTASGTMMPACHTLDSLVEYLKANVHGTNHREHDVRSVSRELEKWFPRRSEYKKYVNLNKDDPKKYTRNLVYGNEHFDCILMCWPAGSMSSIHCHDESSCWVNVVEGTVNEVQFAMPRLDKKFLEMEKKSPAQAVGHCGKLKVVNSAMLDMGGVVGTYANNEIGIHRVENRTDKLACTLHVYAPPLRKMRIFNEDGRCHVHLAKATLDSAKSFSTIMGPEGHGTQFIFHLRDVVL